jgi:uncharacterized protein
MRRSRLFIVLMGAGICLGLLGWLIASLSQFYTAIAATNPLLANTVLWGILLLILVGLGAIAYYFWQAQIRTDHKQRPIQLPDQKSAVAAQNIQAVRQQVSQVQDEIARQALQLRSQSLEQQSLAPDRQVKLPWSMH